MGLMDSILNAATSALPTNEGSEQNTAVKMILDLVQQKGGLSGLIQALQQGGLSTVLNTWLSANSENSPVSAQQIETALGGETINNLASKFGLNAEQVGTLLAQYLPSLVDKATPNGSVQDVNGFGLDDIASMALKSFLK